MSTEKMREEFKYWESEADDGPQTDPMWLMFDLDLNQFALVEIQSRWQAWQASRESLVIELPAYEVDVNPDHDDYELMEQQEALSMLEHHVISKCRKSIEAAGLKVKP